MSDKNWTPQCAWPADAEIRWRAEKSGSTATLSVTLPALQTTIEARATTLGLAERAAWEKYQRQAACQTHEFERGPFRSGAGTCRRCGLLRTDAFDPLESCCVCGRPTYWQQDKDGNWYCEDDFENVPPDMLPDGYRAYLELKAKRKHGYSQ